MTALCDGRQRKGVGCQLAIHPQDKDPVRGCQIGPVYPNHHWNKDPLCGCRVGTLYLLLHAN
jgi:hypothetical protein